MILERLLESQRNRHRQLATAARRARDRVDPFLGGSHAIRALAEEARRIVGADSPVLIQGETGTGKGVLARWFHDNGPRAEEPFVDLNCASLSRELLETELFGHERGAFTGAVAAKPGLFEVANKGTVFLDEIGDVDPQIQPKLLTVLEEKRFRRVGDVRDRRVDVRLIAATHRDPLRLVQSGSFRSDLYFRISTFRLTLPPLRERTEDIPALARDLLSRHGVDWGRFDVRISAGAEAALRHYHWPGNIRELRNVLERAVLLSASPVVEPTDLRFDAPLVRDGPAETSDLTLEQVEARHIEQMLRSTDGRVREAARRLGIPRSTLYQKLRRHRIDPSRV